MADYTDAIVLSDADSDAEQNARYLVFHLV